MQWKASVAAVTGYEQLASEIDSCETDPPEDEMGPVALEQVRAARTAAKDVVASGALGHAETSSFRVELGGTVTSEDEDEAGDTTGMISVQVFRS
jgi:hypothetical protein